MTQIIAALTPDYVVVASDRRLTYTDGPRRGQIADDDTCKLVSLCGTWGIAYTGFARLQGMPTHEWIALRLAENGCTSAKDAANILAAAAAALPEASRLPLEFLFAGWGTVDGGPLEPLFQLVSNNRNASGQITKPTHTFSTLVYNRPSKSRFLLASIGQPLRPGRGIALDRFMRRILKKRVGPAVPMKWFSREIRHTSEALVAGGEVVSVGEKVLGFALPRRAVEKYVTTGRAPIFAIAPDHTHAAFCYFDPKDSGLRQFGPTRVCGQLAVTDVVAVNDPSRDYQSVSTRLLHVPKETPWEVDVILRGSD